MKKISFILVMSMSFMAFSQTSNLPQSVRNSFNKLFPNQIISTWTNNSSYNYLNDWNNDAYYGDYNFDGYPDDGYGITYNNYLYDNGLSEQYYYDDGYYNGYEYNVPQNYVQSQYISPTQYQVNFNYNGSNMTAIFKPNGTFIIAKGDVGILPTKVHNAIMRTFKGKTFRLANRIEEIITPNYPKSNPVYRVKVKIRYADNHILKVDAAGKIISNNIKIN